MVAVWCTDVGHVWVLVDHVCVLAAQLSPAVPLCRCADVLDVGMSVSIACLSLAFICLGPAFSICVAIYPHNIK